LVRLLGAPGVHEVEELGCELVGDLSGAVFAVAVGATVRQHPGPRPPIPRAGLNDVGFDLPHDLRFGLAKRLGKPGVLGVEAVGFVVGALA